MKKELMYEGRKKAETKRLTANGGELKLVLKRKSYAKFH